MSKGTGFILLLIGICGAVAAFWMAGGPPSSERESTVTASEEQAAKQPVATPLPRGPVEPVLKAAPPSPAPRALPPAAVTSSVMPGAVMTTTPRPAKPPTQPAEERKLEASQPRPPMPEDEPARIDAENIALNIRHFGQRFGGNPTGTNAEIVKALTGDNEKGATYLPPELKRLNENGELIDRWGTPYFFHANSATEMEVRSAGPDKTLYTPDDIVQR